MAIDVEGNLIALSVAVLAAFPAAWYTAKLGYKYAKSQEDEKERLDIERSLGRLEGGDRRVSGVEVISQYTLGRMAANLETLVSEIADIKRKLDNVTSELNELRTQVHQNRSAGMNEHQTLKSSVDTQFLTIKTQTEGVISDLSRLRTQVARMMRSSRREQDND